MATRVLIAYDGSAPAEAAVATAGGLFPGATGRLVTLIDPLPPTASLQAFGLGLDPETVQRQLDELGRELTEEGHEIAARGLATAGGAGLAVQPHVVARQGSEWQAIVSEADAIDAEVIVCGSRGRRGLARSLLGSTSTGVLHHASRPVLVVPAPPAAIDGPALIAYDGSEGARAAITTAGRLVSGRSVVVVNVWHSPVRHGPSGRAMARAPVGGLREFAADYEQLFADAARALVDEGLALARQAGFDATGDAIESGSGAWRALAQAAIDRRAAVIVAGSRGLGGVASMMLGSVSAGLVHNAETPALIVRPES
jgi:nucleotide-binding universal stress UspA family protein